MTKFFIRNVSDDVLVSVQNPVRLSDYYEPEPDFALADLTIYDGKRHPRPAEILLIVKVSEATLWNTTEKLKFRCTPKLRYLKSG